MEQRERTYMLVRWGHYTTRYVLTFNTDLCQGCFGISSEATHARGIRGAKFVLQPIPDVPRRLTSNIPISHDWIMELGRQHLQHRARVVVLEFTRHNAAIPRNRASPAERRKLTETQEGCDRLEIHKEKIGTVCWSNSNTHNVELAFATFYRICFFAPKGLVERKAEAPWDRPRNPMSYRESLNTHSSMGG